jgi:NADH-quinone oxidoreductase subunit N
LSAGTTFFYVLAVIGVLNSVISLYYYVRIVRAMFIEKVDVPAPGPLKLGRPAAVLLAVCAIPTVLLGIWWGPLMSVIERAGMVLR